jgi:hypothetical protein
MRKYIWTLPVLFVFAQTGFTASCNFKQPAINIDSCKVLNLKNKVEDNPFFMKNMNGLCGNNFQLSGLPDMSLSDAIPSFKNTSICGALKYVDGGKLVSQINKFLHF